MHREQLFASSVIERPKAKCSTALFLASLLHVPSERDGPELHAPLPSLKD